MKKNILIFYISRESGHYHAACALERGLLELDGDIQVKKINALEYTNPIIEKVLTKAYLSVIKKKPEFWGQVYDNLDFMEKIEKARKPFHRRHMIKIKKLFDEYSPDVIFCTQAFPCGLISRYKQESGERIPLVGILTDNAPHSYWLFDEVDRYVVPFDETAVSLQIKGVPAEKIKVYGIPIDPKFHKKNDLVVVKKELGIRSGGPVVLVMGGSQGLGAMEEIVEDILKDKEHEYQLLVVTGSNNRLYKRLRHIVEDSNESDRVHLMEHVDNIDILMEVADVIVTKAGGLTTAEAMAKELPMMLINPIPGHERMNADFLVKKGVAVEIKDLGTICHKMNELFDVKGELPGMKKNIRELYRSDSAINIARLVVEVEDDVRII